MLNMKKVATSVAAIVLSVSSAVGASAFEWRVKGYNTSVVEQTALDTYRVGVVYEQYDSNGLSTGLMAGPADAELYGLEPYAVATFSQAMTEREWPNRQYVHLYANGINTGKVFYTGDKELATYRDCNFMWELAAPHAIMTRTQALFNDGWYTSHLYPVKFSGNYATVKANFNEGFGFGEWQKVGDSIQYVPVTNIPLTEYAVFDTNVYFQTEENGNVFTVEGALEAGAVTNMTDYNAKFIVVPESFSLTVAGPKFNFDGTVTAGNEFAHVVSAATADRSTLPNFGRDVLVTSCVDETVRTLKTEWVYGGYEDAFPCRHYEILKIDGVLMDGHYEIFSGDIDNDGVKENVRIKFPYIYRYIGDGEGNTATVNLTTTAPYKFFGSDGTPNSLVPFSPVVAAISR